MAIGNVQGFSQGFTQGFGLVNTLQQQKRKEELDRERLRIQEKQADELMKFRQQQAEDTATYRAQTAADTAEYRRDTLNLTRDRLERQGEQDAIRDQTAALNARTALENAKRQSAAEQRQRENTDSLIAQRDVETAAKALETRQSEAAIVLGQIYDIAKRPERVTPEEIAQFDQLVEESGKSLTGFNVAAITSNYQKEAAEVFPNILQRVSKGENVQLNAKEKAAMGTLFGIDGAQYVGKRVSNTDLFVNMPDALKDRKLVIESVGIHDIALTPPKKEKGETAPNISTQLAVVVRDQDTGEVIPYFAPLTEYRDPTSRNPVELNLSEATQVASAFALMRRELNEDSVFRERVRAALIRNKFETEDKFQDQVTTQLNELADLAKAGKQKDDFGYTQEGETLSQLTLQQRDLLRQRVEDRLLYGVRTRPVQLDVDEWVKNEAADIAAFRLSPSRDTIGDLLPQLKTGDYDPNMITVLSSFFDGPKLRAGKTQRDLREAIKIYQEETQRRQK